MLFQKNIVKKYADAAPQETVAQAWQQFKQYFLNPDIQENIRQSKEEQFQEGFLRELFVKVLGYTLNPSPDYNLITEQKNETNSKKADGAILVDGKVVGVIELKDHKTTDLSKIEQQAFGYKNQNQNATYVVISNFEKLRFYIDNAVECVEFDLFHLTENEFGTLWLCLAWPNIAANLPKRIKAESVSSEDAITNALYRDYTTFKQVLYQDILKNNCGDAGRDAANCTDAMNRVPTAVELYKKTQKLLDRLLFIFFAEDGGLLPPNTMVKIIADWEKLAELDEYQPLYNRIKKYFGYLDTGYRGKDYEIFAYNGGLFKPDDVLDSLVISDDVLAAHTRRLSEYDYKSEVDVNILGHIFENSLNEIENVENQSTTESAPTTTTKRKRDGVFYTPQYITKYIVENTVGRLCTDKKAELQINEQEYFADKQRKSSTKKALLEKLDAYRQWLLQITICDPACGSGAFLNAALNFLIAEHRLVDEMEAKVLEQPMVIPNIENSILENNLFGVDINEESVEIAKLSLWLRTARPHRKLNSLNRNIKCGNSLIADPAVAGSKAFDWQAEFPQVFERGGFDVVIGNPPYVHLETIAETSAQLEQVGYATYNKRGDLYCVFVEKGFQIAKPEAYVSYIMPNKWLQAGYGKELRAYFLSKRLEKLIDFGDIQIFKGATTYPCIFIGKNASPTTNLSVSVLNAANSQDFNQNVLNTEEIFDISQFNSDTWIISSQKEKTLIERLTNEFPALKNFINGEAYYGIKTGLTNAFLIDSDTYKIIVNQDEKAKEHIFPFLQGRNIMPYGKAEAVNYLILFEKGWTQQKQIFEKEEDAWNYLKSEYPSIADWLEPFAEKGRNRTDKGDFWWELRACDYYAQFAKPKIMYQAFQVKPCFLYDEQGFYSNNSMWFIPTESKALLAVLNSKMGWWLITKFCSQIQNGYQLIWKYFGQIPIPMEVGKSEALSTLANKMLALNASLQEKIGCFLRRVQQNLAVQKVTAALENFYTLDFAAFTAELRKQKVCLSLAQQDEWEPYFNQYRADCAALRSEIATTDREIDRLVYTLYGLTDEEVKVVEGE